MKAEGSGSPVAPPKTAPPASGASLHVRIAAASREERGPVRELLSRTPVKIAIWVVGVALGVLFLASVIESYRPGGSGWRKPAAPSRR